MENIAYSPIRHRPTGLFARIAQLIAKRRLRQELARLDAHMLDDIGLTPEDVRREVDRSTWDAPEHWSR